MSFYLPCLICRKLHLLKRKHNSHLVTKVIANRGVLWFLNNQTIVFPLSPLMNNEKKRLVWNLLTFLGEKYLAKVIIK